MKLYELSGKDKEKLLTELLEENNLEENQILYKLTEKKGGLFKGTTYTVTAVKLEDIIEYIKDFLKELLEKMGLEVSFESKIREEQLYIKMFSNNNAILIGKNGQTLTALQTIVRQAVSAKIDIPPYVILDVENYKDKKNKNIEYLAKKVAKEVKKTGIDTSLENMNSYERRIVHTILKDFEGITTTSEGEEPNRHVVIKKIK